MRKKKPAIEDRQFGTSPNWISKTWLIGVVLALSGAVQATETTTYGYDALGRVRTMQVSGGVRHGVQESYDYDPAGNRTQYQTVGPANPHPSTVAPPGATVSVMGANAALVVNVGGTSPGGSVTFYVNGMFVGVAQVINGRARLNVPDLTSGSYTITAEYAGDANNDPTAATFAVEVRDMSWLPAVLQLLLAD